MPPRRYSKCLVNMLIWAAITWQKEERRSSWLWFVWKPHRAAHRQKKKKKKKKQYKTWLLQVDFKSRLNKTVFLFHAHAHRRRRRRRRWAKKRKRKQLPSLLSPLRAESREKRKEKKRERDSTKHCTKVGAEAGGSSVVDRHVTNFQPSRSLSSKYFFNFFLQKIRFVKKISIFNGLIKLEKTVSIVCVTLN